MTLDCSPSTQEANTEGSGVQGCPWLHGEFKAMETLEMYLVGKVFARQTWGPQLQPNLHVKTWAWCMHL